MHKFGPTLLATGFAVAASALALPALAQSTGSDRPVSSEPSQGTAGGQAATGQTTAPLPGGSLAQERVGTIGTPPEAARQSGAGTQPGTAAETTGQLPSNSLAAQRDGAIGQNPDKAVQGGGAAGKGGVAATPEQAQQLVGKKVTLASGQQAGTVDDVLTGRSTQTGGPTAHIVVEADGGARKVAVPADKVRMAGGGLVIDMDRQAFDQLPAFEGDPHGALSGTGDRKVKD